MYRKSDDCDLVAICGHIKRVKVVAESLDMQSKLQISTQEQSCEKQERVCP